MTIELLTTVWSIRLALLLFALVVVLRFRLRGRLPRRDQGGWPALRLMWAVGCLLGILHVLAVFQYEMRWSHQMAIEHTARRTQQLIGLSFGGGVYFNYAFLLVWSCDATWWCGWPNHYQRRRRLWEVAVTGYLWFIAFNATVVFETGAIRWIGLLATLAMVASGFRALATRNRLL